jgi:hypothetical protein
MNLKPPPQKAGEAGLIAFREAVTLNEGSLTNRWARQLHRKELARWRKLYTTLAAKHEPGSASASHFTNVATLCGNLLTEYGPEPPPKKRTKERFTALPLAYPGFPDRITHRLHFLEGSGLRRQRAIALLKSGAFVSRQTSGSGRVLVSVGLAATEVRFFERLVEAIGDMGVGNLEEAGFDVGYVMKPEGIAQGESWSANPLDPSLPLARIWTDNGHAQGYSWQAQAMGAEFKGRNGQGLPKDNPADAGALPWDPDPTWQRLLNLTEANRLQEAVELLDTIPGRDREVLFDEVIYLRFLTDGKIRANDIRFLARKYTENSLISGRLLDEFEAFLGFLDRALEDNPPNLEKLTRLSPDFGSYMLPPRPPASDWPAFKKHVSSFTSPGGPRGRIFSVNVDIGLGGCVNFFTSNMIEAENSFRRYRSIPEIGRGWVSEVALLDLIRTIWPSATHQWRPRFLGMLSIDIHVPELRLAVEYQGQQHYEPVALFGGEEGFKLAKARDEKKRALLSANNVLLLEWPYDVPITREELIGRMADVGIPIPPSTSRPS